MAATSETVNGSNTTDLAEKIIAENTENAENVTEQLPPHAFELFLVDTKTSLIEFWNRELNKLPAKVLTRDPTPCLKVQVHNTPFQELLKTHQAE
ncbi:15824_t:CDS:2, partial [Acaulospora morrowiae]